MKSPGSPVKTFLVLPVMLGYDFNLEIVLLVDCSHCHRY